MKRRDFLRIAAPASVLPFALNGLAVKAFGRSPVLDALAQSDCDDHVLVLIQLNGGNDGLNTIIPLDQYSNYSKARANIAIAENAVLKLTNETGIHPQMDAVQKLYQNGMIRVVQSVGYPLPNYSHFRSTDIWLTASESEEIVSTGWLGRYLDTQYPNFPIGYPNTTMPDPLAIQIGSVISTGLEGKNANMGMAFTDPTTYYNITNIKDKNGSARWREEVDYVRSIGDQIEKFATPVKAAATKIPKNLSTLYPTAAQNPLAAQLAIVARLIAGGLKTKIYVVSLSGFDTHAFQNTGGDGTPVTHGTLLNQVSVGINAFMDDLKLLGVRDRVVGMTFSEFGRRIKSNGSGGTDHGAAAPVMLFGTNVISGILGANPTIPSSATSEDNVPMLYDFRSVYASLLRDWFCLPASTVRDVLYKDFQTLPLIKGATSVNEPDLSSANALLGNSPEPFGGSTRVRFRTIGGYVRLALFDSTGRELLTFLERNLEPGDYEVPLDAVGLPTGVYYCRMQVGAFHSVRPMTLVR